MKIRALVPVFVLMGACAVGGAPVSGSGTETGTETATETATATATATAAGRDASSNPAFTSDPPGLTWIDLSPSASLGLVLVSLRFTEDDAGDSFHQECLAEVRNDGDSTLCSIEARLSLQDGDDMERAGYDAFVDAPPFDVGAAASAPCLAPGQRGAFFASAEVVDPVGPETVRSVAVTFSSVPTSATPHAHAPSIDWMSAEHVAGRYYRLVGTASAHGAVHDVALHAYPVVSGVLRKRLIATHPSPLVDASSWSFATGRADAPFTDALILLSFADGSS